MARTVLRTTPNLGSEPLRGAGFERTHSSAVLCEDARDRRRGFTIVELLIVVVVIAILAAITIVAYNGINNRAKASAAASAAEQAAKKVMTYAAVNSDQYPASLSDAGVSDGSASYQYRVDNSTSPKTFCLTATTQSVSYWVSSISAAPAAGACAGHGANGVATITNLARDPRATTSVSSAGVLGWATNRWFGGGSGAGTYAFVTGAADGPSGLTTYMRKTWTTPGNGTGDTGLGHMALSGTNAFAVAEGQTLTFSSYVRVTASTWKTLGFALYAYNSSGTAVGGKITGATTTSVSGTWHRISITYTVPAGVAYLQPNSDVLNGPNWAAGDTLDGTGLLVTDGSALNAFADGNSAGWAWNGAPNNSTSTGPAL